MNTTNKTPSYYLVEVIVGKNHVQGQVQASSKSEAMRRGLAAAHAKFPNSLIVLLGSKVRLIV